ncbi:MAG: hypothetical protein IH612_02110 [Desulfofustis sp.]|nr:hypothetical protein [Desulfofustis sp.]
MSDETSMMELKNAKELAEKNGQEAARFRKHMIGEVIRQNQLFRKRVLNHDAVAEMLSKHLDVDLSGDVIRVKPTEPVFTLKGFTTDADEAITGLLLDEYRLQLIPEQKKEPEQQGGDSSAKAKETAPVKKLVAQYEDAKSRGDGQSMVSIKRQLAQAGHAGAIL